MRLLRRFIGDAEVWVNSGMSESLPSTDAEGINPAETTIPVSRELRDKIRLAKTRQDVDYDTWLRENLSLEA